MNKIEAKYQTVWGQYVRAKKWHGYFELKVATGNTFIFSAFEDHQIDSLHATQVEGLYWKFSDEDRRKKPCDMIGSPPMPSYVVIIFGSTFHAVNIDEITRFQNDGRISITKDEVIGLSERIVHLSTK